MVSALIWVALSCDTWLVVKAWMAAVLRPATVSAFRATRSSVVNDAIELRALSWSAVMEPNWPVVRLFRSSLLKAANCAVVMAAT